jgi:hypothetical protein
MASKIADMFVVPEDDIEAAQPPIQVWRRLFGRHRAAQLAGPCYPNAKYPSLTRWARSPYGI